MQYELKIPEENKQCHIDLEDDIGKRGNGLFTFIIRIHDGKITDYNLMEYVDARRKYFSSQQIIVGESFVARHYRK